MAQSDARAWWADVQHLRDAVERTDEARRRADQADLAARRATRERRQVEAEIGAPRRRAEDRAVPRRHVEAEIGAPRRRAEDRAAPRFDDGDVATARRSAATDSAPRRPAEDLAARRRARADIPVPAPRLREHAGDSAMPVRRTVEIRGRTVPAPAVPRIEIDRRRPPRRAIERVGPRPDRMAMWALLMGLLLIAIAIGTADAGTFGR